MKLYKQFSIRRRRSPPEVKVQDEVFNAIDRRYRTEMKDITRRFEKVAVYVNDVFRALANYDARFEFDPLSLDDCRCDIVSDTEINLICELKHLPECFYEVQGDGLDGTVKIKLNDDFHPSSQPASWNDVCPQRPNTRAGNFLDTRALLDVFTATLGRAMSDVWSDHRNVGLVYRVSGNLVSIYVDIPDEGFFTVTLIPALRLSRSRVSGLSTRTNDFFQSMGIAKDFSSTVYAAVRPSRSTEDELWRLIFNNVGNQILHSEKFPCGHHCFYTLRHLINSPRPSSPRMNSLRPSSPRMDSRRPSSPHRDSLRPSSPRMDSSRRRSSSPRFNTKQLSSYHIQLVILKECAKYPDSMAWAPAKLQKRLVGITTSLKSFLKEGEFENPFTGMNVFSDFDQKSLKVLTRDVDNAVKSVEKLLEIF